MELNLYEINKFNKELKNLNEELNNEDNKKVFENSQKRAEELKKELKKIQINQIQNDGNLTAEEWSKKDFLEKEIAKNEEKISEYEANKEDLDKKIFKKRLEKEEIKRQLDLEESKIEIEILNIQKRWNEALREQNENTEKIKQLRLANRGLDENSNELQTNLEEINDLQNKNEELTKIMQESVITSKKGIELTKAQEEIRAMKSILESGAMLEGIENPNEHKVKPEETKPEETKPKETKPEETKPEETKPEETKPEETKPEETKPEETKLEETKPEETKPEETKPEETKPEETKPEETKPEETKPEETKPEETKPEETKPEDEFYPSVIDINISAKENKVYLNNKAISNFNIEEILEDKEALFKRMYITDKIIEEAHTLNPFKILNLRRKIDPVVLKAIERSGDLKSEQMIRDYIWSLNEKELSMEVGSTEFDITYNLEESSFNKNTDKKMQKYGRFADKIEGIEVTGLKEKGPRAWFKNMIDRVKTLKLPIGQEKIEETIVEEPKGYKAMDKKAQELQMENERDIRENIKYHKESMDRFVNSYEDLKDNPDFDLKTFMHQASRELSSSEYSKLGILVNGKRNNGGFKAMDQKAKVLQEDQEETLKEDQLNEKLDEIFSKAEKKLSELREEDGVIVEKNDELYDAAVKAILNSGEVKTSTVMRELGIGYAKASKLIDQMEEKGVISGYNPMQKGHKILISKDSKNNEENKTNTQSHKTQEGQAFSDKYKQTVDHEKAYEAVKEKSAQPTVEKEKQK